jgi:ribosomal protein L37AE/L43A
VADETQDGEGYHLPEHDLFRCPNCGAEFQVGAIGVDTGWYGCDRCGARWNDTTIMVGQTRLPWPA